MKLKNDGIKFKDMISCSVEHYIILTDKIKKKYPKLKNITMVESLIHEGALNWKEAKKYAKNLRKGGFTDWRLPKCGCEMGAFYLRNDYEEDELLTLYDARRDLHKLAVEQGVEDDFIDYEKRYSDYEYKNSVGYLLKEYKCLFADSVDEDNYHYYIDLENEVFIPENDDKTGWMRMANCRCVR